MIPVTLNNPIALQLGSTWEIQLSSSEIPGSVINWSRALDDSYPAGQAYANGISLGVGVDHSFLTFMEPGSVPNDNLVAVPEPQMYVAIFAAGLFSFGFLRRFRHR